jgi:hypothetical protein
MDFDQAPPVKATGLGHRSFRHADGVPGRVPTEPEPTSGILAGKDYSAHRMLASLRTYRSLAAALATVLLLGVTLPLVRHACASVGQGHAMASCCCASQKAAPHPAGHEHGTHGTHHGTAEADHAGHTTACPHEAEASSRAASARCCTIQAAEHLPEAVALAKQVDLRPPPFTPALAAAALPAPKHVFPPSDTGPPLPRPVALHLLHAVQLC